MPVATTTTAKASNGAPVATLLALAIAEPDMLLYATSFLSDAAVRRLGLSSTPMLAAAVTNAEHPKTAVYAFRRPHFGLRDGSRNPFAKRKAWVPTEEYLEAVATLTRMQQTLSMDTFLNVLSWARRDATHMLALLREWHALGFSEEDNGLAGATLEQLYLRRRWRKPVERALFSNRDIVLAALAFHVSPGFLTDFLDVFVDATLLTDEVFCLDAVAARADVFPHAAPALRHRDDFVLQAVRRNGRVLEYASDSARRDLFVVGAAIRNDSAARRFVDNAVLEALDRLRIDNNNSATSFSSSSSSRRRREQQHYEAAQGRLHLLTTTTTTTTKATPLEAGSRAAPPPSLDPCSRIASEPPPSASLVFAANGRQRAVNGGASGSAATAATGGIRRQNRRYYAHLQNAAGPLSSSSTTTTTTACTGPPPAAPSGARRNGHHAANTALMGSAAVVSFDSSFSSSSSCGAGGRAQTPP